MKIIVLVPNSSTWLFSSKWFFFNLHTLLFLQLELLMKFSGKVPFIIVMIFSKFQDDCVALGGRKSSSAAALLLRRKPCQYEERATTIFLEV